MLFFPIVGTLRIDFVGNLLVERDSAGWREPKVLQTAPSGDVGDPYEIRTHVAGVRGRSLRPLDQRAKQRSLLPLFKVKWPDTLTNGPD